MIKQPGTFIGTDSNKKSVKSNQEQTILSKHDVRNF